MSRNWGCVTVARGVVASGLFLALAGTGWCIDPPDGITNGLIAYYPFDTSAADASGRGHDGVMTNGASISPAGRFDGALLLDGSNDYVRVPGSSDFRMTNFSFSVWVKMGRIPTAFNDCMCALDNTTPSLAQGGGGIIIGEAGFNGHYRDGTKPVNCGIGEVFTAGDTNIWHLYTFVNTWSGGQSQGQTYLDGMPLRAVTNTAAPMAYGGQVLYIGENYDGRAVGGSYAREFKGLLDDVRIYSRALSHIEVATIFGDPTLAETVTTPVTPTGPGTGESGTILTFTTGGATNSAGHDVEYRFDWGDGSMSAWGSATGTHVFAVAGGYSVKAQARCAVHTNQVSEWSAAKNVVVWSPALTPGLSDGLVAYYPFNVAAEDGLGLGHDGTLNNGAFVTSTGRYGGALYVDGVNDYARVPGYSALRQTNYSFSVWVCPEQMPINVNDCPIPFGYRTLNGAQGGMGMYLAYMAGGCSFVSEYRTGSAWINHQAPGTLLRTADTNTWHLFAGTCLWSNNQATLKLYLDGRLVGQTNRTAAPMMYVGQDMLVGLGYDSTGLGGGYNREVKGKIDELRIYSRVLSEGEMATLFGDPAAAEGTSPPTQPTGPGTGESGAAFTFTTGGSTNSAGHDVEYRFDWGDGSVSDWGSATGTHAFAAAGGYQVKAQARCAVHTNQVSAWSAPASVVVWSPGDVPGLSEDLVAHYSFNFGAMDVTGNGHDGTLTNGASISPAGRFGGALLLDGSNDYVRVPGSPEFALSNFSFSAWIKPGLIPTVSGYQSIILSSFTTTLAGGGGHWHLALQEMSLLYRNSSGDVGAATTNHIFRTDETNAWIYVTAVCSWSNNQATLHLYKNGILMRQGIISAGPAAYQNQPLYIGLNYDSQVVGGPSYNMREYKGLIDDLKIFRRALTPAEVACLYGNPAVNEEEISPPDAPSGPVAGYTGQTLAFSATGSVSEAGHTVEYRFDWGDGAMSDWGSGQATHAWAAPGAFMVKAQARCAVDTNALSLWSEASTVDISTPVPGLVRLTTSSLDVSENAGSVTGWVERTGGCDLPARVEYSTVAKTAKTGLDFIATTGTLFWVDGEAGPQAVVVPIVDDTVFEGIERFTLSLSNAVGAAMGSPASCSVYIEDDDAEPVPVIRLTGDLAFGGVGTNLTSTRTLTIHNDGTGVLMISAIACPAGFSAEPQSFGVVAGGSLPVSVTFSPSAVTGYGGTITVNSDAASGDGTIAVSGQGLDVESISAPAVVGVTTGFVAEVLGFTASATSSHGHAVSYRFAWGNNATSAWGAAFQENAWTNPGLYEVRAQAQCAEHPDAISAWSDAWAVNIQSSPAVRVIHEMTALLTITPPDGTATYGVEDELEAGMEAYGATEGGQWDAANRKVKWTFNDGQPRVLRYYVRSSGHAIRGAVNFGSRNVPVTGDTVFTDPELVGTRHPADGNQDWRLVLDEVMPYADSYLSGLHDDLPVVSRGLYLYKKGEAYLDNGAAQPGCWKPRTGGSASRALALLGGEAQTGAVRSISGSTVTLQVIPPAGVEAWGVEDTVPAGLTVTWVSGDGQWDAVNRKVKWVTLSGGTQTVSYTVSGASAGYDLQGRVSFDGSDDPVTGTSRVVVPLPFATWLQQHAPGVDPATGFTEIDPQSGYAYGLLYAFGDNFPSNAPLMLVRLVNGCPVIDIPAQDELTLDVAEVLLQGTTNLLAGDWSGLLEPAPDTTGMPSTRRWWSPIGDPLQFFTRIRVRQK